VTVPGFVRLKCTSTTGFRPYDSGYGPHEIVVSPDHEIAYVPNYGMFPRRHHRLIHNEITHWYKKRGGSIANLNLDTVSAFHNSAVRSLCRRPHGVATDGARLWVTCEEEGAILELKARDWSYDNVLRVRKLGQKGAHQLKLSQDGKLLAATNIAFGTVSLIDLQTERTSTLEVGMRPEAMAFAPDGQRLFVLNERSNSLSVVHIEARKVVRTLPTGGESPSSIAVAAGAKEIWISHNASPLVNPGSIPDLTILDLVTLQEKQRISLRWRPLTLILSDDEQWVFVSVPRRNEVWAYDTATRERRAVIPNMMDADGLAFVPAR